MPRARSTWFLLTLACKLPQQSVTSGTPDDTAGYTSAGSTSFGSSSSEATTTTSGVASTGSSFVCGSSCPDLGPPTCDGFAQDCPEGFKCAPVSTDGDGAHDEERCVPLAQDPAPPGAPCTSEGPTSGLDTCDVGAMCRDIDMEGMGTCVPLCVGSLRAPTCSDPLLACQLSEILKLCVPKCDPLDPSACPGELCLPMAYGEDSFICILDASGDGGQINEPCTSYNGCKSGLICNEPTAHPKCDQRAPGCCQPYCDRTKPVSDLQCDVEVGQTCLNLYSIGEEPIGCEHVGVCGIPR